MDVRSVVDVEAEALQESMRVARQAMEEVAEAASAEAFAADWSKNAMAPLMMVLDVLYLPVMIVAWFNFSAFEISAELSRAVYSFFLGHALLMLSISTIHHQVGDGLAIAIFMISIVWCFSPLGAQSSAAVLPLGVTLATFLIFKVIAALTGVNAFSRDYLPVLAIVLVMGSQVMSVFIRPSMIEYVAIAEAWVASVGLLAILSQLFGWTSLYFISPDFLFSWTFKAVNFDDTMWVPAPNISGGCVLFICFALSAMLQLFRLKQRAATDETHSSLILNPFNFGTEAHT